MRDAFRRTVLATSVCVVVAACGLDHPDPIVVSVAMPDAAHVAHPDVVETDDSSMLDEEAVTSPDDDASTDTDPGGDDGGVVTDPDASTAPADGAVIDPSAANGGTVPSDHASLATRGGNWGNSFTFTCDRPDEVAVGIWGNEGTDNLWVDQVNRLGLLCGTLHADGSLTAIRETGSVGDALGAMFFDLCPGGQVLVGLDGHSSTTLDGVQAVCAHLGPWLASGTVGTLLSGRGGGGGMVYHDRCAAGYVANAIAGKWAHIGLHDRLTTVQLGCVRVRH